MNADVIRLRLQEILDARGKSLYWLAKETGLPYISLANIKHGKTEAISFRVLERVCDVLDCEPGELIVRTEEGRPKSVKVIEEPEHLIQSRRLGTRQRRRA